MKQSKSYGAESILNTSAPTNLTLKNSSKQQTKGGKGAQKGAVKGEQSAKGQRSQKNSQSQKKGVSENSPKNFGKSATKKANSSNVAKSGTQKGAKNAMREASSTKRKKDGMTSSTLKQAINLSQQNAERNNVRYGQPKGKLKVMFLGGVGEIGKNMTVFEYGNSIVVLDAGMSFPGTDMPGVDVVIPDFSYLAQNRSKIKGILLTHGHEDHIGAIPYLVEKLEGKLDIYGTKLTLALVENKLVEHNLVGKVNMVPVSDKSVVSLADFTAEFIHVSHSVAGSVAIVLRTPVGVVLHTGDFKIDYTPLGNEIMNLNRIAEVGKQGVLLLMSESTNVEKPGYTMSESVVEDTMNKVFHEARGRRLIVATFASNVDRIGMIIELAKLYKRKIAVSGRSMQKYIESACRVGQMTVDPGMLVDIDKIGNIEDGKLVILSTGSQGEPMSALTRMASGEFNKVQIGSNDTIVISASPIPGNERDVYNVVNKLYRLGAMVVYSALSAVHVSGHACQEELKLIYTLVKPKYFIPVHGEYRHLKQHAMLVERLGHKHSNVIIPDIGDCVEVDNSTFKVVGQIASGNIMVDGLGVGDVGNIVLKDRLSLAEEGILVCSVAISKQTGELVSDVELTSRGCFFIDDAEINPMNELKSLITAELNATLKTKTSIAAVKTTIQRTAKHFFRVKLKRNPVVLALVLEV
ncbi:MAG: ribonuclease J [Candidatus Fimimonas sp.]